MVVVVHAETHRRWGGGGAFPDFGEVVFVGGEAAEKGEPF